MTYVPVELLSVYLEGEERRKVGRLALRRRQILFEYDTAFLASGIEISPLKLPLRPGVFTSPDGIFDGLHGVFNDSLPDGWGRLLLDRGDKSKIVHGRPRTISPSPKDPLENRALWLWVKAETLRGATQSAWKGRRFEERSIDS